MLCDSAFFTLGHLPKVYYSNGQMSSQGQVKLAEYAIIGRLKFDMRSRLGILWHVDQVLAIEAFQNRCRHSQLEKKRVSKSDACR